MGGGGALGGHWRPTRLPGGRGAGLGYILNGPGAPLWNLGKIRCRLDAVCRWILIGTDHHNKRRQQPTTTIQSPILVSRARRGRGSESFIAKEKKRRKVTKPKEIPLVHRAIVRILQKRKSIVALLV